MKTTKRKGETQHRAVGFALFLAVEAIAAVFFLSDAVGDLRKEALSAESAFEFLVGGALLLATGFGAVQLRHTLEDLADQARALETARGELGAVIARQFAAWGLTPAERDVAMLALKGLDVAEIAEIRGAAQGTVRAQLTHIYSKAGVTGRAQFAAWFVEDLLG